ncbi:MAG: hypothetical protein NC938_01420 [Candidatus Omnitrophica bacterium]|nr:hypothetical protein [Candidatus Omnitrophota bacterium]MCM8790349.1 hypothetical protein [Candidatus Omnitrophota bacterium]
MRRYFLLMTALIFLMASNLCLAEDEKADRPSGEVADQRDSGLFGINFFKPRQARPLRDNEGPGISRIGTMDPGQSYDQQTGMPNVVPSDDANEVW